MLTFWRRSILARAAIQVVGIGLIVGLAFVFLTAYLTERNSQQGVSQRIRELIATVESTAQIACFTRDPVLAMEVVNGLITNSEVLGATIIGGTDLLAENRKAGADAGQRGKASIGRISKKIASPFDTSQIVGEMIIDPDPEIVSQRVKESGVFVALLLGLQSLIVVFSVAAAVLLWIVRPIKRMSDKLHVMDAHSVTPLSVPRGYETTEIGRLAADINQLGQRLTTSLEEEHHLHVQREIGERKYRAIFENADSGIFVVDQHLVLESCNQAFYRQLGLPVPAPGHEKINLMDLRWQAPEAISRLVGQCAVHNRSVSEDFEYLSGPDGEVRWFNVTLTPVGDQLIQGQLTDISRHKLAELSAQQEAITDPLTGLLNRAGFLQNVDAAIAACQGDEHAGFALFVVDLDSFRRVNESLGMSSGDEILAITGQRLRSSVKSSDCVARLGNDSFGVILRATVDERAAAGVAVRISAVLKGFYEVGSTPLQLGASIGITLFPHDGADQESLLRNAEMALDHARVGGNGRYCFFDFTMARNAEYRRALENELRFAVRRNELTIHFQPIIDLSARGMVGAEALIRWEHPQRGLIPPDFFIPLAEETGAIANIGLWMVETVCQQLAVWKKQGIDWYISINVSARQIPDGLPPITLIETVNRYGVDPAHLAIEITESVFMGDSEVAKSWLEAIHELGFRIYLDDFGTGYSSLSYIKRFPVDVLKIDKSFVRDMGEDNSDRALVGAIINMARSLDLAVVAEGVESQRQLDLLEAAGCSCVQGYYFSRPVKVELIEDVSQRVLQLL